MRPVGVVDARYRGAAALRLDAGATSFTVLPGHGLTGVSLRHDGGEYLAVPGGLDAMRIGKTNGLPLLAPWANRLSSTSYRVGRVAVDVAPSLADGSVRTDPNGLPIHGLLAGRSSWSVSGSGVRRDSAWLACSIDVDHAAFPFPHRIEVGFTLREGVLTVDTRVVATGLRRVPLAFGWHPYLRVPGARRDALALTLPALRHHLLDERNLPTGEVADQPRTQEVIGRRRFDDLYAFAGRSRTMALAASNGRGVEVRASSGYPFAQVWVPDGRPYASLEPMVAPTDALSAGSAPMLAPGESYDARFLLRLR